MSSRQTHLLPPQTEAELQANIRLEVGKVSHARLFRNQVGEAWMGDVAHHDRQARIITLNQARRVPFGLAPGSADLIGWTTVTITPDMVGTRVAVFTSGEVKRPTITRLPDDQQNWCDAVRAAGGFADMLRSVEDGRRLVRG